MAKRWMWVGLMMGVLTVTTVTGCKGGSDSSSEDDDGGKKKKKKDKKKKKKDDDDGDAKGTAVPGIAGFVVPSGGVYKHVKIPAGKNVLEFESYTYPTSKFPVSKLRASFVKGLESAGWKVASDSKGGYTCSKGGRTVPVLFGEAKSTETKVSVFPPR